MIVGGFDIATTTGCAVLDGTRVLFAEAYTADGDNEAEVFRGFRRWFRYIIKSYGIQRIAMEQPLRTPMINQSKLKQGIVEMSPKSTMKVYLRLYGLRTLAVTEASVLDVPLIEVNMMTWRKSFTGNPRAEKEETLALAQRIVPGLKSKDAAEAIGIAWHLNGVLRSEQLQAAAGDAEPCLL
jgi:Holliday junction resolvasome RuvABC endonuclease subunit